MNLDNFRLVKSWKQISKSYANPNFKEADGQELYKKYFKERFSSNLKIYKKKYKKHYLAISQRDHIEVVTYFIVDGDTRVEFTPADLSPITVLRKCEPNSSWDYREAYHNCDMFFGFCEGRWDWYQNAVEELGIAHASDGRKFAILEQFLEDKKNGER